MLRIEMARSYFFINVVAVVIIFLIVNVLLNPYLTPKFIIKATVNMSAEGGGSHLTSRDKFSVTTTTDMTFAELTSFTADNINVTQSVKIVIWCPDTSPLLEGPHASIQKIVTPQELIAWFPSLELGGRLRPKDCVPRQRLAIIIPFRNRHTHLHIMMNNLVPFLQRQQADVTFFVVEQTPLEKFNRGALLNIGYLEANKLGGFDCFIFHDVDLIPLDDHNIYRCGNNPRHFAVAMNKYGYKLPFRRYFGGVVGFSKKQYLTVNGCSNVYFGWGGEDDDLLFRVKKTNYTMVRYDPTTARYDMIKHERDKGNEVNPHRKGLLRHTTRRQDVEGLNTTRYKVNGIRVERLYTWINVTLNMTEILQTVPAYTLNLMKKSLISQNKAILKSSNINGTKSKNKHRH